MNTDIIQFQPPLSIIVVCLLDFILASELLALGNSAGNRMVIIKYQITTRVPVIN
jgi:hypothetical protein